MQTYALTLSHINICHLNFKKIRNFAPSFKQAMLHDCVADTLSFGMAQTNALECLPTYSCGRRLHHLRKMRRALV